MVIELDFLGGGIDPDVVGGGPAGVHDGIGKGEFGGGGIRGFDADDGGAGFGAFGAAGFGDLFFDGLEAFVDFLPGFFLGADFGKQF